MTKAQVLLPSADVLKALARVLTVQADGRAEQKLLKKAEINRKTRKIAKMPRFSLQPSAFIIPPQSPPQRQRRGIVVASKPPRRHGGGDPEGTRPARQIHRPRRAAGRLAAVRRQTIRAGVV